MELTDEMLKKAVDSTVEEIEDIGGLEQIGASEILNATNDALRAITATLFALTEVLIEEGVVSAAKLQRKRLAMTAGLDQDLKRFQDAVNERIRPGGCAGDEG